ncbi:MAG: GTPase ObgE, partial [Umezawaea sp.]
AQVTIGDLVFDWEPSTPAGIAMTMTGRGTDLRLENNDRIGAHERKALKKARRLPGVYDEDDFEE